MEDYMSDWYVKLNIYLKTKADLGDHLTRVELYQLNYCVEKYDLADSVKDLIHNIAAVNDCGKCDSWQDLIDALAMRKK